MTGICELPGLNVLVIFEAGLAMHPDKIGPYLIERKIGSGGMGNVYLGRHQETGHEVAVKVLPASMAREEGFVLRFSREIEALRKLNNDHIVELFEDGQTDEGSYYYSMEFVDGETLTSMVSRRKRIPWQEVIEITLEIATALKAAHNAGIIHRDLKPSNLMVRKDGHIKLTDFGVAHVFATTRLTRTGGVVGTAEYMSPEQARGKRATKHSDLYSLGAVMYVMLTGRPPFTGKLASDILHQHQFSQFDKPTNYVSEIPRLLEEFVCQLLEKKPEKRHPDALVAIKKLENVRARIEFEQNAKADTLHGSGDAASDHTMGGTADQTRAGTNPSAMFEQRPGPATIVRDVLRQDLENQLQKSPLQKFFDNTFVLVFLFALVVATGFYLLRANARDPGEEFESARVLMQTKAGPQWMRAREILVTLKAENAFPEQQEEINSLIGQADQYEFCRRLKVNSPTDGSSESEVQRLVWRATESYSEGSVTVAKERLQAVQNLIADDPKYAHLNQFLMTTLQDWGKAEQVAAAKGLLNSVTTRAQRLMDSEDYATARSVLKSAILLYSDESSVAVEVAECQKLLESMPAESVSE